MLLTHTKPRPDLNDGQPHEAQEPRKATALHLTIELARIRKQRPFPSVKVPK